LLKVYDQNMKPIGILENAFDAGVERRSNELWTASFSMPIDDPKNALCNHFNFVEFIGASGRNYGLYRIMPRNTKKTENKITYSCEHVLATLLDDVMDGYFQFTNYTTAEVIQAILDLQEVKNWELGRVDFTRYFHYSFENENGLLAPILSIPQPFNEPYLFTFDTTIYPWKLNLIRPSDEVVAEIRWGKDMIDFEEVADPTEIVNYIIPKGSGEGVNQLTIEKVNDGKRYLKDDESIARWGLHKYIWIDQRFTDAASLMANAESLLSQWKDPKISFSVKSADLSILPEFANELKILYGVTRIIVDETVYTARIVGERIADILEKEWDVEYEINNKLDDIATTQADIERRIQVNEAYSQGATNIMNFSYQDNCDENVPALIPFYIDDDVVNINTCELTFRTKKFRAYSRATKGGGATTRTTKSGGGTTVTSEDGGGTTVTSEDGGAVSKSTNSGGGAATTSGPADNWGAWDGDILPIMTGLAIPHEGSHIHGVSLQKNDFIHYHSVDIPAHSHDFEIPDHTHKVTIPAHSHRVTIPSHTHEIELPDHTHEIDFGIFELDEMPTQITIKVDGNTVNFSDLDGDRIDLIPYLEKDSDGRITRGRHEVEILPNARARIEADLILRVFIRSHLGGVY